MHRPFGSYYDQHAEQYFRETIAVDTSPLYERFLPLLPAHGHILDAGCGSGRDARTFLARGYRVTAFDASAKLAALAEAHIGQTVHRLNFQNVGWQRQFDGIWACASLLHVPAAELFDAMQRLCNALKSGGILYASFKYGYGERDCNGRRFTDLDETGLAALLQRVEGLEEMENWTTRDLRAGHEAERWLNTLLRRKRNAWDGF